MGTNLKRRQQIEKLYVSSLEREPGQRGVYLAEVCQGDDELRRAVEALLAQEGPTRSLTGQPAQTL